MSDTLRPAESQPVTKICRVCGDDMDPNHTWWWTDTGAVCSSGCARWESQCPR